MRNFQIKSILLGIGIGVVFTSVIGMIYSAGSKGMSKEEVIAKAAEYGMVETDSFIGNRDLLRYDKKETVTDKNNKEKPSSQVSSQVIVVDTDKKAKSGLLPANKVNTAKTMPSVTPNPTPSVIPNPTPPIQATKPQTNPEINHVQPLTGIPTFEAKKKVEITIAPGDNSYDVRDKLFAAGLISDRIAFEKKMEDTGYDRKIMPGKYIITVGTGDIDMMKIVCRRK